MKKERKNMATIDILTIKLVIDPKENKVLFAEASKDFVDSLFYWLSLPIGNVIKLLTSESMVGSFGNLYTSFLNLKETYMKPDMHKNVLLNPRIVKVPPIPSLKFYTCQDSNCKRGITNVCGGAFCPGCFREMTQEIKFVAGSGVANGKDSNGYVKEAVSYMISDGLTVTPISAMSIISLMKKFNVSKPKMRKVQIGLKEAHEVLRMSFQSTTVLTDVFLGMKSKAQNVEELRERFAEEMEEKREEIRPLDRLVEEFKTRWLTSDKVLHNVHEELMNGFRTLPVATNVGVKWMGKIDPMPFKVVCAKKGLEIDPFELVSQLETGIGQTWHPIGFRGFSIEGEDETPQVVKEYDNTLKELRSDWGDEVYDAVVKALTEIIEYNPTGKSAVEVLWNFKKGRKASVKEAVRCLSDLLKTPPPPPQSSKRSRAM